MTKLEAIQGVLNGTYDKVTCTAFAPQQYIKLENDSLVMVYDGNKDQYKNMNKLNDVSWFEFNNTWDKNIPDIGILVFVSNNVKRAISSDGTDVTFDDGSTASIDDCTLLSQTEFEALYTAQKQFM